jgi:hypothetical protein
MRSTTTARAAIHPHGVEVPLVEGGPVATPAVVLGAAVGGVVETTVVVGLWVVTARLVLVVVVAEVLAVVVVEDEADTEDDAAALVVPGPLVGAAATVAGADARDDGSDSPVRLTGGRAWLAELHAPARESVRQSIASRDHVQ